MDKLVYLERTGRFYGSSKNLLDFSLFFQERGAQVNVFLADQGDLFQRLRDHQIPVEVLQLPPLINQYNGVIARASIFKKMKMGLAWLKWNLCLGMGKIELRRGIFLVNNTRTFIFFLPTIFLKKLGHGCKVVWRIQTNQPIHPLVKSLLYAISDMVVVHGGNSVVKELFPTGGLKRWFFRGKKIRISRNSIHVDAYRQAFERLQLDPDPHFFKICMIPLIEKNKGVLDALKGLKFLLDKRVNAILVHCGGENSPNDPHTQEVNEYIRKHRLGRRVKLMGYVNNVGEVIGSSDLNILPSRIETQPYVITEASCLSVPSMAYDVGSINEQILDGESGYLLTPGDLESMKQRALFLARNPDVRKKMGARAYDHVKAHFDFRTNSQDILSQLNAL